MDTTPASSLTRYRPIVLAITGFTAAYGAYLVYKATQTASSPPPLGIHRSNAVSHRPRRPARLLPQQDGAAELPPDTTAEQVLESLNFGSTESYGRVEILDGTGHAVEIELRSSELPSLNTLQQEHGLNEQQARRALTMIHSVFVHRFMVVQFQNRGDRASWQTEIFAAARWLERLGISEDEVREGLQSILRDAEQRTGDGAGDDADTIAGTEIGIEMGRGRSGLNLKQLLYHIAENQARQDGFLHRGFRCDSCGTSPIRGTRWKCANCPDLDLCNECHATYMHVRNHIFYEIKIPTYAMNNLQPVQEISYPGRVDVSKAPNLPAELCKDLVDKSDMEKAEIEGLYEQFLCLASSKRQGDTLEYAIDRMTFPHIISPLSPYAPTRPSLVFDRLFAMFDRNRDGLVDFEEFVMGVVFLRNRAGRKDKWRKTFEAYDLDGDGYVTRADFLRMFRALFMIQKDLTLDLVSKNEAVNGLRDITPFAQSGRVISAAFNQNPREIGEARLPIAKSPNAYGDVRHQPEQDVVVENGSAEGDPDLVIGHAWESQAQFPFNNRTGEPLSLRDFLYLAPRDSLGQAPTDVARDQRVHFAFDGQPITEARMKVVEQRKDRRTFYDISEYEDSTSSFTEVNGYQIPKPAQDVGNDIAYQVMEESLNELVDPMFKAKEDLHMEAHAAADEINRWRSEIEEYAKRKKQEREAAKRAANDPLMAAAAAAERDAWLEREAKYEAAQDSPVEPEPNGHPTFPPANGRRQGAMANLVADLEGHVQARPLRELLDSEGFAVRNDQPLQQAVTTPGSTTATHVDISTTSPELAAAADNTSLPLPPSAMTPPATEPSGTLCPPQPHTASREPTGAPTLPQYRDPTMPQYKPNSQKELEELLPRDVTLDSLRSRPAISQPIDPTPEEAAAHIRLRFEANIIHQFEYMFLGWERDPDTGLVINATTQAQHEGNEEQSPSEARLERLAELKQYLVAQRKEIPPGALDYAEFESIVLGTGGSEFKFLEGWLEQECWWWNRCRKVKDDDVDEGEDGSDEDFEDASEEGSESYTGATSEEPVAWPSEQDSQETSEEDLVAHRELNPEYWERHGEWDELNDHYRGLWN